MPSSPIRSPRKPTSTEPLHDPVPTPPDHHPRRAAAGRGTRLGAGTHYPPGGPLDLVARALAERVKDRLGTVVVENRPGAGGDLGADLVAKAAPDGNTLVMGAV